MTKFAVVCWKWKSLTPYRSTFNAAAVNILYNMVKRHLHIPFEFICITDDAAGINPDIRIIDLWENPVPIYGGVQRPNCFYRVKAFSEAMKDIIAERFLWLDLDAVILKDITPLVANDVDFKIWGDTNPTTPYNGSMVLMNAGARKQVYEEFDPKVSPHLGVTKNYIGSDQAWIGYCLGENEQTFTKSDGVYSYRMDIRLKFPLDFVPEEARIVFFHGKHDPWDDQMQQHHKWVRDNYK